MCYLTPNCRRHRPKLQGKYRDFAAHHRGRNRAYRGTFPVDTLLKNVLQNTFELTHTKGWCQRGAEEATDLRRGKISCMSEYF